MPRPASKQRAGGTQSLRIAVTGLAATYPFGGVFWDYMQYVLGLRQLGHDVVYVEDTGKWCYDPIGRTFVEGGEVNARHFSRQLQMLGAGLEDRWFFRDAVDRTYGMEPQALQAFLRSTDLLIHLSASCILRPEYLEAKRIAFIDSDPLYTQGALLSGSTKEREDRLRYWKTTHDVFFTFGENVGHPTCLVPTAGISWIPTRQPVVLSCFENERVPLSSRRRVLTTVASWEPTEAGPTVAGIAYKGKSTEFLRFQALPSSSALPLEVAMSGEAPTTSLREKGWRIIDAYDVTKDPWMYRDYLANSLAEWSVAKNAYAASRSGWFSCRSACYLALGVPVVVQDTGFGCAIPTGQGVLAFQTPEQAADAIRDVVENVKDHSRAAVDLAQEYFCSDKLLTRLIEQAMNGRGDHRRKPAAVTEGAVT